MEALGLGCLGLRVGLRRLLLLLLLLHGLLLGDLSTVRDA